MNSASINAASGAQISNRTGIRLLAAEIGGACCWEMTMSWAHVVASGGFTAVSSLTAEVLKLSFGRAYGTRAAIPTNGSRVAAATASERRVTLQASVTPFIANYARLSLDLVAGAAPPCDAIARLKSQEHWQTDVIAGWVLGTAVGYWATTRSTPLSVQILPRGLSVGYYTRF